MKWSRPNYSLGIYTCSLPIYKLDPLLSHLYKRFGEPYPKKRASYMKDVLLRNKQCYWNTP